MAEAPAPGRVFASPRARKIAAEKHVPLGAVAGSGPGGRIVERDVRAYLTDLEGIRFTPTAARLAQETDVDLRRVAETVKDRRVRKEDVLAAAEVGLGGRQRQAAGRRVSFTPMRRTIAERMAASKQTVPHFYLVGQVNMGAAMRLREDLAAAGREKPTVTALLVKAVALALKEHPRINARFDGDAIVLNEAPNVGVAVAVEDGLFVPVIRKADGKDLAEISSELKSLAETARAGKLIPQQYEGGSITISNLGTYGVDYFLPIINPPEACIIGVGAIADQVIPRDGSTTVEPIMKVSLSADHRVVNGAEAAEFFRTLKGLMEEPSRLGS
jgi:pyruvate dehydrogenase E2 component (dihydrolipoamide acetyltransferase)